MGSFKDLIPLFLPSVDSSSNGSYVITGRGQSWGDASSCRQLSEAKPSDKKCICLCVWIYQGNRKTASWKLRMSQIFSLDVCVLLETENPLSPGRDGEVLNVALGTFLCGPCSPVACTTIIQEMPKKKASSRHRRKGPDSSPQSCSLYMHPGSIFATSLWSDV